MDPLEQHHRQMDLQERRHRLMDLLERYHRQTDLAGRRRLMDLQYTAIIRRVVFTG